VKFPSIVRMSAERYFRDPCPRPSLNSSIANVLVNRSPRHAYHFHPRLGGEKKPPTKSTDHGSISHALALGRGRDIVVVDADDWRKKESQDMRTAAYAEGKLPCLVDDFDRANHASRSVLQELVAGYGIKLTGTSEITLLWIELADDGTEVMCRAQLDHWIKKRALALDLKFVASSHPDVCVRQCLDYGYHLQRAAYVSGLEAVFPELTGRIEYLNVFCESSAPYVVTPATSAGTMRTLGEHQWQRAVNLWARCLRDNSWPGYVTDIARLEAPPWAIEKEIGYAAEV
jgi:hypothetical protein